jgi:hypothetical protein
MFQSSVQLVLINGLRFDASNTPETAYQTARDAIKQYPEVVQFHLVVPVPDTNASQETGDVDGYGRGFLPDAEPSNITQEQWDAVKTVVRQEAGLAGHFRGSGSETVLVERIAIGKTSCMGALSVANAHASNR